MKKPFFPVKSTVVAALVSLASFAQSDSPPTSGSQPSRSGSGSSTGKSTTGSAMEGSKSADSKSGQLNKDDLDFVKEAVAIGRHEVRISQLAATQASDPSVKELAQQMVSEHQSTNDELREIVEGKGYSLPMDSSAGASLGSGSSGSGSSGTYGSGSTGSSGSGTSGSFGSGSTGASGSLGSGSTGASGSVGSSGASGSLGSGSAGTSGSIGTGTQSGSDPVGSGTSGTSGSMGNIDTMDDDTDSASGSVGSGSTGSSGSARVGSSGASGSVGSSGASGSIGSGSSGTTAGTGGTGSGNTLAIDQSMQKKYDDKYEQLSKLSGSKFDREYLANLVDGHKKSIKAFEKASKRANDSELKSFATRTLPTLQQHLDRVQSIEKDVKGRRF
jgi:predicted outer membrane protein